MFIFLATVGIMFLAWDLAKKSTFKLVLASTFLFCAIVAFKFPENKLLLGISCPVFAGIFYILIKTILKKEQTELSKEKSLKDFIGKFATVEKDIGKSLSIDGIGLIKFNDKLWQAKSIDDKEIKAGSPVEIVSKENMIMNVKVIENANK